MANATCNGIRIEYDTFGAPDGLPLLLVMGLGGQMIAWDEGFCEQLADIGHHVVRFDNRDVGLSTKFESAGVPNLPGIVATLAKGETPEAPYHLRDMAADAIGLLDHLDIGRAHVVGASMGGMIVQTMAIEHTNRVASMVSIMSTTGHPDLPKAEPAAMARLMTPAPAEREAYLDHVVASQRVIGSPGFPFHEARVRERAGRAFDRSFHPPGAARQTAAIMASGSRREALSAVRVPTVVIHGEADPLVPIAGGLDTHQAIPGSEFVTIEGMGHDLPKETWPRIIESISKLTASA